MRATYWTLILAVAMTAAGMSPAEGNSTSLDDGLVAHWTFDATSTNQIVDVTGNGHDGTAYGASRTDGVLGNALEFTGDEDAWVPAINQAPSPEITSLTSGSIALWLRYVDTAQEAEPLFYLGNPDRSGKPGFIIEVGHPNNNKLYFTFFIGPRPDLCFDSNSTLVEGQWYHFVGVVGEDFNTGYLNGVELTDRNYNAGGPDEAMFFDDLEDLNQLTFGSGLYYQTEMLFGHGAIDDVRIYDRPLNADEAWALYAGTEPPSNRAPNAADDVATTDEGTAVVIDVLGNDNDPDGDALHVSEVTTPLHGATYTDGSTVTYTPQAGFVGADEFSYTASDPSGAVDTATVSITVGEPAATEPPSAPSGLTGVAQGTAEVFLTWVDTSSGSAQEDGFELQRSNRSLRTRWTTIATIDADGQSFVDSDIDPGSRYAYRVRAFNNAGDSPWSNRIRVAT